MRTFALALGLVAALGIAACHLVAGVGDFVDGTTGAGGTGAMGGAPPETCGTAGCDPGESK
jgi:hypothetical protein